MWFDGACRFLELRLGARALLGGTELRSSDGNIPSEYSERKLERTLSGQCAVLLIAGSAQAQVIFPSHSSTLLSTYPPLRLFLLIENLYYTVRSRVVVLIAGDEGVCTIFVSNANKACGVRHDYVETTRPRTLCAGARLDRINFGMI